MIIELTYLDSEGYERTYQTRRTHEMTREYINKVFLSGYVIVPCGDRRDVVPVARIMGMRIIEEVPDATRT